MSRVRPLDSDRQIQRECALEFALRLPPKVRDYALLPASLYRLPLVGPQWRSRRSRSRRIVAGLTGLAELFSGVRHKPPEWRVMRHRSEEHTSELQSLAY